MKKRIAIYTANSKFTSRDLSPGFCDFMEENFIVTWITISPFLKPHLEGNNTIFLNQNSRVRYKLWLILYELRKYNFRKGKFKDFEEKPFLGLSKHLKLFLSYCIEMRLSFVIQRLIDFVLKYSAPIYKNIFESYDCILFFTSPNDLNYDDINRHFKKQSKKAKRIIIPINWDNSTSKPYLTLPDVVLTWGIQTARLSRNLHEVQSLPLGSPRFDAYLGYEVYKKNDAKIWLGLNPSLNYIFFAGSSFAFDEIESLNRLSDYLDNNGFFNYRIIYRPHPYPWPKIEVDKNVNFTKYCIQDAQLNLVDQSKVFNLLFASTDILITPFSTMLLEAAFHGKPTLCLGFNSDLNPDFNWENNSRKQPHLLFIEEENWVVTCYHKNNMENAFRKILNLIDNRFVCDSAKKAFRNLVYFDKRPYAERLVAFVDSQIPDQCA
jgi:hypothetical protein